MLASRGAGPGREDDEPPASEGEVSRSRKPRRRKSGGLLVRIRESPARRPKHPTPLYKRVVQWVLGLAVSAVILGAVVLLGVRFFNPNLGAEVREATVRIEEIVAAEISPSGRSMPIVIL